MLNGEGQRAFAVFEFPIKHDAALGVLFTASSSISSDFSFELCLSCLTTKPLKKSQVKSM